MKTIKLSIIYDIAKASTDFEEFEQIIKAGLTGKPITTKIDCEPLVFDAKNIIS